MRGHIRDVAGAVLMLSAGLAVCVSAADITEIAVQPGDTLDSVVAEYVDDPRSRETLRKYNPGLPSDAGVPLPRTRLKIPTALLKRQFRAGMLVYAAGKVLARPKDTSDWQGAVSGMLLHDGDGLRTLEDSRARVRFAGKAMLELEPNSLAILQRPRNSTYDLSLEGGRFLVSEVSAFARGVGFVPRVRDTSYSVTRIRDRETEVRVHHGEIGIRDAGDKELAVVGAGYMVRIPDGRMPSVPEKIALPTPSEVDVPIAHPGLGVPVAAYHVQVARDKAFADIVLEKRFDFGTKVRLGELGLPPGEYWMRVANIDLLGDQEPFSAPRFRRIAATR